jgi:hypothetical protein
VVYQCTELDPSTGQTCLFRSKVVEDTFKHRLRHRNKEPIAKEAVIE